MEEHRRKLDAYLTHRSALIDYAAPIVGDRARAEDVVQEAWLRMDDAEGDRIAQPGAYLYRVVRNLAIDLSRRLLPEIRGEDAEAILASVPELAADPETRAIDRDELETVLAALEALPDRTREAFRMHRFEDYTYAQIGLALGISQTMAHRLVGQAMTHCMRRIMDDGR